MSRVGFNPRDFEVLAFCTTPRDWREIAHLQQLSRTSTRERLYKLLRAGFLVESMAVGPNRRKRSVFTTTELGALRFREHEQIAIAQQIENQTAAAIGQRRATA